MRLKIVTPMLIFHWYLPYTVCSIRSTSSDRPSIPSHFALVWYIIQDVFLVPFVMQNKFWKAVGIPGYIHDYEGNPPSCRRQTVEIKHFPYCSIFRNLLFYTLQHFFSTVQIHGTWQLIFAFVFSTNHFLSRKYNFQNFSICFIFVVFF